MSFAADMRAFASGFKSGMQSMDQTLQQEETKRHNIASEGIARDRSSDPTIGYPGAGGQGTGDGGTGSGSAGATGGGGKVDTKANGQTLMKYYTDLGYSKEGAAGIVGNLHAESGLNPIVRPGDKGTAHGIAQWRGSRWQDLQSFASRNGGNANDLLTQAKFLDYELSKMPGLRSSLMKATDPNLAANLFARDFERPQGSPQARKTGNFDLIHNMGGRRNFAQAYLKGFGGGGGGDGTTQVATKADPSTTGSTTTAAPKPAAPRPAAVAPGDTTDQGQGIGDAKAILADPNSNEGMKEQARRTLKAAGISVAETDTGAIPGPGTAMASTAAPGAEGFNPIANAAVQLASAQPDEEEEQPMLFAQGGGAIPHFASGGTVKKPAAKKAAPKKAAPVNPKVENKSVYGTPGSAAGAIDYYDWLDQNTARRASGQEELAAPTEFAERPTWVASVPTVEGGRFAPGSIGPSGRAYLQGAPGNTMATQVYKNAYTPGKITSPTGELIDPVANQQQWQNLFRQRQADFAKLWDDYSRGGQQQQSGQLQSYQTPQGTTGWSTIGIPGQPGYNQQGSVSAAGAPRPTMSWDYRGTAISGQPGLSTAGNYWDRPATATPTKANPAGAAAAASGGGGGFENFSGGTGTTGGGTTGTAAAGPTDQRYGEAGNQFNQQANAGKRIPGVNGMYAQAMPVSDQWNFQTGTSQPTAMMPAGSGGWWGWEDGGPVFYQDGGRVLYMQGGVVRYREGGPVAGAIPSPATFRGKRYAEGGTVEPSWVVQRGGSEAQSPDPVTLSQAKQRITDRNQAYKVGLTQGDIDRAKSDPSRYGPYYGPGGKDPETTGSTKKPPLPPKRPADDPSTTGSTRVIKESRTKDDEPQPYPEDPKGPGWPRNVDPDRFKRDEPPIPEPEKPKGPGVTDPRAVTPMGDYAGPYGPIEYAPWIGPKGTPPAGQAGPPPVAGDPTDRTRQGPRGAPPMPMPTPNLKLPTLPTIPGLPTAPRGGQVTPGGPQGLGGGEELPGPPVPRQTVTPAPDPRLPQAPPGMVMVTLPNGQQTFVPEEQAAAYSGAITRPHGAFAQGGAVPHFEGGGPNDPDSVYGANANYATAVQRGQVAAPTQGLPGTPGAIPSPGAPPNALPVAQQAPPSANSAGGRPADVNAGPAPPPSEATMTNTPRPQGRTGYYQMPDADEIARLNKLGLDTLQTTIQTRARSAEGAIPSADGQAHQEVLANALGSNALAPTSGDMKVAYDAVDPERKLSSDELTMKTLQDMTDYWYAHGRPDKAGQAAMSLMLYGKKVATGAGQQARAAFEDGDVAKGLEWLQKGYSYIPDGRTAQYKVGPDGKSAEVWFVNPDGSESEHQNMDSNGLRNLSLAMSNGSAWMQASQGAITGKGGNKSQFSETKRREDQGAIDNLQAAGRAWQKNPDDEEAKRAYEDAYDEAIATTGRAALVKQADQEFRPDRYKKAGAAKKPGKEEVETEKFETTVKQGEDELDTQIKAATDDKTKARLTTEKTWVRPTAAFNRQKVDQSIDRKGLAAATEDRDDAEKIAAPYQELGENVLQRNPLSARTVVRLFDQLRSGAEPKVLPDGRVQVPGFAPLYIDMYTLKSLAKLGRFEPAK